ncbi:hypothetical protein ACYOEI_08770 [Singulisphaera rosea]
MKLIPILIFWSLPWLSPGGVSGSLPLRSDAASTVLAQDFVLHQPLDLPTPDDRRLVGVNASLEDEEESAEDDLLQAAYTLPSPLDDVQIETMVRIVEIGCHPFRNPSRTLPLLC